MFKLTSDPIADPYHENRIRDMLQITANQVKIRTDFTAMFFPIKNCFRLISGRFEHPSATISTANLLLDYSYRQVIS